MTDSDPTEGPQRLDAAMVARGLARSRTLAARLIADGLVTVTPVFQASYSGLFKMFFDVLDQDALNGMPTIIAATARPLKYSNLAWP